MSANTARRPENIGLGREGPKFAVKEMTEERLAVFNA